MPNALITLPDVYESVVRRVAVDVTAQLARVMRLPESTLVYLPGNSEVTPMNGGTFGDCCDTGVHYPAEAKLIVRYNEDLDENQTLITPVNNGQHLPIFLDEVRDIVITPVYRYVDFAVTFEYTAPNITVVQRWMDEMRSRISMMRAELYQTLEYHYAIPKPVLELLASLHETMETSDAPTGDTYEEYFNKYIKVPTKTATTVIGTQPVVVIPEKQFEVLGWFDFTTTPDKPEKHDNGSYTATFTYTLHYNRPMQVYCHYPLLVHNKHIKPVYRPEKPYESFKRHTRRVSMVKGAFDSLQQLLEIHGVPYIHHPNIDDWVPPNPPLGVLTFMSALLRLKVDDLRTISSLFDLGEFTFTPYFLEYFNHQGDKVFDKTTSVFEFRLYENHRQRTDVKLRFKPGTLVVEADRDLDLTRFYHLQISIRRNWYQVGSDTLQNLRRYPVVAYLLLRALGVTLGGVAFKNLKLLGQGIQPPVGTQAQCTTIGDPVNGGTWPWPWLEAEWGDIPYPAETWEGSGWPGGGWNENIPWPAEQSIPTWPGDPAVEHICGGEINGKDFDVAVAQTDDLAGNPIDNIRIGWYLVLYSQILSFKRSTR